uniref:FAD-dependent oxidoreductase n=1 Tax=Parasutterella excrementihominis TaxID=487175 RepID=UPI003FF03F70
MLRRSFTAGLSLFAALPLPVFAQTGDETKFDLIIIGIGAAGLSVAVSAAQNGVKNILLIDKAAFVGGHSALSGGSVNAVYPELQMKQGIKDSPEFWQRQIMETGEFQSDPVLVNTLVNNAQATLHWLREIGIPFDDQVFEAWGGKFQRAHSAGQKLSLIHI